VWVIAILTLVLGASVALVQRDIKRMLAYSSINHAGFVLLGLQAASARGVEGSLYYLFVYTFMVIGTFAVITVVGGKGDGAHDLERYRGLASRQPWLAAALTVLLMAQAGIPFTTGFLAKLEVIEAAVKANSGALAVVAMVTAVIAAFFYLRVILLMYSSSAGLAPAGVSLEGLSPGGLSPEGMSPEGMSESSDEDIDAELGLTVGYTVGYGGGGRGGAVGDGGAVATVEAEAPAVTGRLAVAPSMAVAIAVCVVVTVLFGLWPAPIVNFAHHAVLYSTSAG
jgi:NADH-quinone oxidoreductase subunit N